MGSFVFDRPIYNLVHILQATYCNYCKIFFAYQSSVIHHNQESGGMSISPQITANLNQFDLST